MHSILSAAGLFLIGFVLMAQTALNNESVIKLIKAALSDDLIVSTIRATPGTYDVSADGLIAIKAAGASDSVVSAIVSKASSTTVPHPEPAQQYSASAQTASKPRVFLQSASKGTNRNAARDQSMEMSKDFEKDCPGVRITLNQQMADYTVALNHIEAGFVRDNQIQIADRDGDLVSRTKEGGSIAGGMKKACSSILANWGTR